MWKSSSYPASSRTRTPSRNRSRCVRRIIRDAAGKGVAGRVVVGRVKARVVVPLVAEAVAGRGSRVRVGVVAAARAGGRAINRRVAAPPVKAQDRMQRARRVKAAAVLRILRRAAAAVARRVPPSRHRRCSARVRASPLVFEPQNKTRPLVLRLAGTGYFFETVFVHGFIKLEYR